MLKKITLFGLMLTLAATALYAAQGIAGGVGNVDAAGDAAFGGQGLTVGNRVYSVSGPDTTINGNGCALGNACCNARCRVAPTTVGGSVYYRTATQFGGGGYLFPNENTGSYNADADGQTYYSLIDAEANAGTCNHIGYYALQGQIGSSTVVTNTGNATFASCGGSGANNCFTRVDTSNSRSTAYGSTKAQYPAGSGGISSIGGLSVIPVPRVSTPGADGCPAGQTKVTWEDPVSYAGSMKNGVSSPLLGVKLYKNDGGCGNCPTGDVTQWTAVGTFGASDGATGTCVPVSAGGTWFAMSVRVKGPSNAATEIESGIVGGAGFVGANSQCVGTALAVQIQNVRARYMGRATVSVDWTTGTEAGVQGFYVQRATSPEGPFTRVSSMTSPIGDGNTYTFSERVNASMGKVLYYNVQVVNADGTMTEAGTTAVTLPAAKK